MDQRRVSRAATVSSTHSMALDHEGSDATLALALAGAVLLYKNHKRPDECALELYSIP